MENKPMISETEKREALKQFMAEKAKAPVCVAFSGGVDSSLILKLACDTAKKTGMPVYAVTFHTMLHPACDLEIAERVAKELGAIHKIIQVNEMELEAIRTNPVNRCYICKHHLFATLLDFAKEEGIPCVMDGTNESDLHYRLLTLVWGIAIAGILVNALWINCPKWFSSLVYIAMGWICVLAFRQIVLALPKSAFLWLLTGGLIYTAGGIIYALKLPIFNATHKNFGSHEIFHLFVMGGSLCHYVMMYAFVA